MRNQFRKDLGTDFEWAASLPIVDEWNQSSGALGSYFYQDRLVATWIKEAEPLYHYDVGSRLDGFIGSLSVFREVDVIDIRPQPFAVPNVRFHQMDLMHELPSEWVEKAESLSCLHTIEHFGLGRYGDSIDVNGHLKGLAQLKKMVCQDGILYLSTPIGPQRVEFNAHRIFSVSTLLGWFADGWEIERFAVLNDLNQLIEPSVNDYQGIAENYGCRTGVGIIAARKRS